MAGTLPAKAEGRRESPDHKLWKQAAKAEVVRITQRSAVRVCPPHPNKTESVCFTEAYTLRFYMSASQLLGDWGLKARFDV